jgi:hypothetical protein
MLEFNLTDRNTIFTSLPHGGIGAEIGVDKGGFAPTIFDNAQPSLLYLIDCWVPQSKEVYRDAANTEQNEQNSKYYNVLKYHLLNPKIRILKLFSEEAVLFIPDNYFDWIYLDANHSQCYKDLKLWWNKIKPNGWFMGHDFINIDREDLLCTVKNDVERFIQETQLPLLITHEDIPSWIIYKTI